VNDNGTFVTVEFKTNFGWTRSANETYTFCNETTIKNRILVGYPYPIYCRFSCTLETLNNPSNGIMQIGDTKTYCSSFNVIDDWIRGDKTFNYTIPKTDNYQASFSSSSWTTLVNGGNMWELRVKLDVTNRSDTGLINTSPITQMPQYMKLRKDFRYQFEIPVYDVDGDFVRCRYALASNSECGDICSIHSSISVDSYNCTFTFDTKNAPLGIYALALEIEDFMTSSSINAMSSVPVQFLIEVVNITSNCTNGY
jgi:hypothetical protein